MQVIVIGCIFAFILKKLSADGKILEVELAKNINWIQANLPLRRKPTAQSKANMKIRLTESFVEIAHKNRLEEMRMISLTVEICAYFMYMFLILLIAYGHRSPDAYLLGKNVNDMMIHKQFDQVNRVCHSSSFH